MEEVRNLLIRNVIPIMNPDNMGEESADSFLSTFGGYMKQIAAVAKHDSGFALYESNVAPIHEEYGDFFSTVAKITEAADIRLYAVLYTFIDSYYGVDPAYKTYNANGIANENFVCPIREAFWAYLRSVTEEVIEYPIAGVILLGNTFVRQEFCFCEKCKKQFSEVAGIDEAFTWDGLRDDDQLFSKWLDWRAEKMYTAISGIYDVVKQKEGVDLLVGVDIDPEVGYEKGAFRHFGQDVEALSGISGHLLININPWSPILPSAGSMEYNNIVERMRFIDNITARRRKVSFKYWTLAEEKDFETVKGIATRFKASQVIADLDFPEKYRIWREAHLSMA
ncbi:MAG: hypothetical protein ACETWM_02780 [Candidatus Lokiarchaeia archaeon]